MAALYRRLCPVRIMFECFKAFKTRRCQPSLPTCVGSRLKRPQRHSKDKIIHKSEELDVRPENELESTRISFELHGNVEIPPPTATSAAYYTPTHLKVAYPRPASDTIARNRSTSHALRPTSITHPVGTTHKLPQQPSSRLLKVKPDSGMTPACSASPQAIGAMRESAMPSSLQPPNDGPRAELKVGVDLVQQDGFT